MEKNTISEQLKILIQTYGLKVLGDSGKINGILADFFPKAEKERAAIRSALKAGAGRMFHELSLASPVNQPMMLKNIRKKLSEEAWLSDQACDYVCTVFLRALDIAVSEPVSGAADPVLRQRETTFEQKESEQRKSARQSASAFIKAEGEKKDCQRKQAESDVRQNEKKSTIGELAAGVGFIGMGIEFLMCSITGIALALEGSIWTGDGNDLSAFIWILWMAGFDFLVWFSVLISGKKEMSGRTVDRICVVGTAGSALSPLIIIIPAIMKQGFSGWWSAIVGALEDLKLFGVLVYAWFFLKIYLFIFLAKDNKATK